MVDLFFISRAEEEGDKDQDSNSAQKKLSNYDEEEEIEKASPNKNADDDDELEREDHEEGLEMDQDNNFDLDFRDKNEGTRETIIHKESNRTSRSNRYEVKDDDESAEVDDIFMEAEPQPEEKKVEEEKPATEEVHINGKVEVEEEKPVSNGTTEDTHKVEEEVKHEETQIQEQA